MGCLDDTVGPGELSHVHSSAAFAAFHAGPAATAAPRLATRLRRIALLAAAICLIPATVSLIGALSERSNSGLSIRLVEWMRDHGARALVNKVESIYYSLNAPSTGGRPCGRCRIRQGPSPARDNPGMPRPAAYTGRGALRPLIRPALPGEGLWHATFAAGAAHSAGAGHELPPDPNTRKWSPASPGSTTPGRALGYIPGAWSRAVAPDHGGRRRCRQQRAASWWRRSTVASS